MGKKRATSLHGGSTDSHLCMLSTWHRVWPQTKVVCMHYYLLLLSGYTAILYY